MTKVRITAFHNTMPAIAGATEVFNKDTIFFPKWISNTPEEHLELSDDTMFKFELWLANALENKPQLLTSEAVKNALRALEGRCTTVTIGAEMQPLKVALAKLIAA